MKLMKEAEIEKSCKMIIEDLVYRDSLDVAVNERNKFNNEIYHCLGRATVESDIREVYV